METFINHDTIALSRENDLVTRAKLSLGLEVMKRKLGELREKVGMGGGANKSATPLLADGDTTKEFDKDMLGRADATGRSALPASPMDQSANTDGDIEPYKDMDEEETAPESTSTFQGVTPAEDAAFEKAFIDAAAWTPLPDDDLI